MRTIAKFLLVVFSFAPAAAVAAPVSTTAGSNLTGYNGSMGSVVGNQWNNMTNSRSNNNKAQADYDNCGTAILRCAKPRCSGGGCAEENIAKSIVSGCINSNKTCRKYSDELVVDISARLMAESVAIKNQQDAAAAAAATAAQNAARQDNSEIQQQIAQMQDQIASMQQQNNAQLASLQNTIEENQRAAADAASAQSANNASNTNNTGDDSALQRPINQDVGQNLTPGQSAAVKSGVSDEVVQRATISGQILSDMQGVDSALSQLKTTMRDAFRYAKCNEINGDNCDGPKRVKKFKELAMKFFDPYDALVENLEDSLYKAMSVGVDLGDVYMMLSGSCSRWAEYICRYNVESKTIKKCECTKDSVKIEVENSDSTTPDGAMCGVGWTLVPNSCKIVVKEAGIPVYDENNCDVKGIDGKDPTYKSIKTGETRGGRDCAKGQVIPPEDLVACTINKFLNNDGDVQEKWLNPDKSSTGSIRIGCGSDILNSGVLKHRSGAKKGSVDINILQALITQDAPSGCLQQYTDDDNDPLDECVEWCGVEDQKNTTLVSATRSKNLDTSSGTVCYYLVGADSNKNLKGRRCEEDNIEYINPELTLCSVHAYNMNQDSNPSSSTDKETMKEIIGLKSTVITQQMYKQYMTVENMIKRLKIQIEKAALKAELKVAKGTDDDDDGGKDANAANEFKNCRVASGGDDGLLDCLRYNYAKLESYVSKNSTKTKVKKQIAQDVKTLDLRLGNKFSAGSCGSEEYMTDNQLMKYCLEQMYRGMQELNTQNEKAKRDSGSASFRLVSGNEG